ncbi:MAG: phage virion morphogenesis protein [Cyanobacteria bacterium P01_F01_bin.3]
MTAPLVTIQYDDLDTQRYLAQTIRRFRDLSAPMREIGEVMVLSTDERFEREIDPKGRKWKDISPKTRARKRAMGRIDKILQDTGTGRASINYQASKFKVAVGTPLDYMADHQLGRGQEVREPLGVSEEDRGEIVFILGSYAVG